MHSSNQADIHANLSEIAHPISTEGLAKNNQTTIKRKPSATSERGGPSQSCLVQIYPADIIDGMLLLDQPRLMIGRESPADLLLPDPSVSRQHAEIIRQEHQFVLRDLSSTNGTLVNGSEITETVLGAGDTIRIGSFLFKYLSAGSIESQYHETVYQALTKDALTGAMNKRYLQDSLGREVSRAARQQIPLALVMIDIDHFKSVNDTHGHLVGDQVLRELGRRILSLCREEDVFARFGGEEFCLMLTDSDHGQAFQMAERCRSMVASEPFETDAGPLAVTASFGVACLDPAAPSDAVELLEFADQQLYAAKTSGRNRVCG